jgi:hypothetical protein
MTIVNQHSKQGRVIRICVFKSVFTFLLSYSSVQYRYFQFIRSETVVTSLFNLSELNSLVK